MINTCIHTKGHMLPTSHFSPSMAALHPPSLAAGITSLNEIGFDPGVDHLLLLKGAH